MGKETAYQSGNAWPSARRLRAKLRHVAFVALAALLPPLLGLPVLSWQARQAIEAEAAEIHEFAATRIAAILTHASDAAGEVTSLVGSSCAAAGLGLRLGVTAHPFVRSLNLAENGRIYCSSLEGSVDYAEEAEAYADGRLRLMPGNQVTPSRALVVYRQAIESGSVLVGIDGQHVFDVLSLSAKGFTAQVGIKGNWVGSTGVVTAAFEGTGGAVASFVASTTYPFTVGVAYDKGRIWRNLATEYWPSWLLLALLGGLSGYAVHRFASRHSSLTAELQRAVEADEFVPFYQPIILAESGKPAGAEVLVRWMHPGEGLIPPNQFVPLAERTGLIVPMTYRLMEQVKRDLSSQLSRLPARFHIGFNICAAHCKSMELLDRCRDFLEPFPPDSVVLFVELTEREAIPATPLTDELFMQLDRIGVQVALDDFGTGNSSLEYLQRFTVNALKIDQSFVAKAGAESLSSHILDIVADLAGRLKLALIAEGVETTTQREYLEKLGVDYMQGYLFGRPVPFSEFASVHLDKPVRLLAPARVESA